MKDLKIEPMKLIVSIVERGQGRNMIELFNGHTICSAQEREQRPLKSEIYSAWTVWKRMLYLRLAGERW